MNARHWKFLELSNLHRVKTLILCAHWSFNIPKSSILDGGGFLQRLDGMSKLDGNSKCIEFVVLFVNFFFNFCQIKWR